MREKFSQPLITAQTEKTEKQPHLISPLLRRIRPKGDRKGRAGEGEDVEGGEGEGRGKKKEFF